MDRLVYMQRIGDFNHEKKWWKINTLDVIGLSALLVGAFFILYVGNDFFEEIHAGSDAMHTFYLFAGMVSLSIAFTRRFKIKQQNSTALLGLIFGLILIFFGSATPIWSWTMILLFIYIFFLPNR